MQNQRTRTLHATTMENRPQQKFIGAKLVSQIQSLNSMVIISIVTSMDIKHMTIDLYHLKMEALIC